MKWMHYLLITIALDDMIVKHKQDMPTMVTSGRTPWVELERWAKDLLVMIEARDELTKMRPEAD